MLLEDVIKKAKQKPQYDWEGYYAWLFNQDAGREVTAVSFWECQKCLTINVLYQPARYGKCRCCGLIHIPS